MLEESVAKINSMLKMRKKSRFFVTQNADSKSSKSPRAFAPTGSGKLISAEIENVRKSLL